jgi:hypothetical protein
MNDARVSLAIGCPVAQRDWILPRWFDHVEAACIHAQVEPTYVFVVHPEDPCWAIIDKRASLHVRIEPPLLRPHDRRIWKPERYQEMVQLRNQLLGAVRLIGPDAFLSVDSDILLAPHAISLLLQDLDRFDAVGGKCFMTPSGRTCPSWANIGREGSLMRQDADGVFDVEVIMAIKMMSPAAYAIDYEFHLQGEDIGWCRAATRSGLRLGWNGRVCSKHVLEPEQLDVIDSRCGF